MNIEWRVMTWLPFPCVDQFPVSAAVPCEQTSNQRPRHLDNTTHRCTDSVANKIDEWRAHLWCYVSSATSNPTHSLTRLWWKPIHSTHSNAQI